MTILSYVVGVFTAFGLIIAVAISILPTPKTTSSSPASAPRTVTAPSTGGSTDSDSTDSDSTDSDLDRYLAELNAAPDMSRFVSSVAHPDANRISVYVTGEYHQLPYHDRLKLAQIVQQAWIMVHSPNNPEKAWSSLKAADGTTVGGTDMWGKVWVEK